MPEFSEKIPHSEVGLPNEVLFRLINFAANSDLKLLTAAIVNSSPGEEFTQQELRNAFLDRQGDKIVLEPPSDSNYTYCVDSLQPAGLVECIKVQRQRRLPVAAVTSKKFGEGFGLAFEGALLDWSLVFPETHSQRIFGDTHTVGKIRAPQTRFLLLSSLLDHDNDQSPSYVDLEDDLSHHQIERGRLEAQLRKMEQLGILSVTSILRDYNPKITILNSTPLPRRVHRESDQPNPNLELLFKSIGIVHMLGLRETDLEMLLATCQKIDPEADLPSLRKLFLERTHKKYHYQLNSMVKVIKPDQDTTQRTTVKLSEGYSDPVKDLILRIKAVSRGESLEEYRQRAIEIVNDPTLVNALLLKTLKFSNAIKGRRGGDVLLQERILSIVEALGSATVRQVQSSLTEEDMVYNDYTVRKILDSYAESGEMEVAKTTPTSSKRTQVRQYRAVSLG